MTTLTLSCGGRSTLDLWDQQWITARSGAQASSGARSTGDAAPDGTLPNDAGAAIVDAGPPPVASSCVNDGPGLSDCGENHESCCISLTVPGGTFSRTYTNHRSGPRHEADPATVSTFRLDKYLVTVGRYRTFRAAWNGGAGYLPPSGSGKHAHLNGGRGLEDVTRPGTYEHGWHESDNTNVAPSDDNLNCEPGATWTPVPGDNEQRSVSCLSWADAYAFCIWDGGFLPSEAEWEYAGAGGAEQREYPWGSADPGTSSMYAIYDGLYPPDGGYFTGAEMISPVGYASLGAARWGHLDMAGEQDEWMLDYTAYSYVNPCVNGAYLSDYYTARAMKGCSASDPASRLPMWVRDDAYPPYREAEQGVRCARVP